MMLHISLYNFGSSSILVVRRMYTKSEFHENLSPPMLPLTQSPNYRPAK